MPDNRPTGNETAKRRKRIDQFSIRTRAAIQINAIVLVITIFTTIIGIYFSNREISKTVSQDLILVGNLASDMIVSSVESIKQEASYIGDMMDKAYTIGGLENLLISMENETDSGPYFVSLAVAFPDGRIYSREKRGFAYSKPSPDNVTLYYMVTPWDSVLLDESEMVGEEQYVIRCFKRISDNSLFIATLRGEHFSNLISKSNYGVYDAGSIFIIDSGYTMIAHSGEAKLRFSGNDLADIVTNALYDLEARSKIARYRDENGIENICAYTPIVHGNKKWVLFLTLPVSQTPVSGINRVLVVSGLIFLVCGVAASIFLSKRQAKPYIELNRRNEELVVLREEAEKISRAKADFLANMSHEMRTPMNAIIGMTSIGRSAQTIEKKDYSFGKINDASKHLLGVINDVLDMSKIEANKLELSPTDFNFEKMLQKVVNVVNFRIDERGQHFYINIDNRIPRNLIGDDQRLAQVITNLLSNAVKFTPEEGTIRLDAGLLPEEDGSFHSDICRLRISVTDTGIGITEEQKSRLFQSFEQAEAGTSRRYGGTGLGLAITKRIVELMDGRIWVESASGCGSTFIFTALLKRGSDERRSLLDEDVNWSNIRVFAVDDESEIRDFFTNVFANLGIKCTLAESGEEAVELLAQDDNYDVYFIDWKLPGMSGIDLIRRINQVKSRKSMAIIFSSADWSLIEDDAHSVGVNKFIPKPLFQSNIVDTLSECIGFEKQVKPAQGADKYDDFSGHTILIAEDVEINREIILTLLEPMKLKVECAENGIQAYKMFEAAPEKYDMVFMDVQMPEMDGYDSTRHIRAIEEELRRESRAREYPSGVPGKTAQKIPIIAMTANVFREDIEKCLSVGMNGHIGKPIDFEKMLEALRTYLI